VREFKDQGYCSFTLHVSHAQYTSSDTEISDGSSTPGSTSDVEETDAFIIQIRPEQHSLDISVAHAAVETYGRFTPRVRALNCHLPGGLQAFEMNMVPGMPFSQCQLRIPTLSHTTWNKQVSLVESFASFIARAWLSPAHTPPTSRNIRADSPMTDIPTLSSACTGKVGANILPKLAKLARELQDSVLRERAVATLEKLMKQENHMVVLNHGDLIPSNVLVDEETWEVTGVVDWAEAEWLPLGTCLYGLEHLLGYMDYAATPSSVSASLTSTSNSASTSTSSSSDDGGIDLKPVWRYYNDAARLRELFWMKLYEETPGFKERAEEVMLARDLGILLWFGYAWDEGAIDRVVNEEQDPLEVECLRVFLAVKSDVLW
jgi:hypothetical protein